MNSSTTFCLLFLDDAAERILDSAGEDCVVGNDCTGPLGAGLDVLWLFASVDSIRKADRVMGGANARPILLHKHL